MQGRPNLRVLTACLLIASGGLAIPYLLDIRALSPDTSSNPEAVTADLLQFARHARVQRETRVIEFGTPAGEAHYSEPDPREHRRATGFHRLPNESVQAAVAMGEEATVRFDAFGRRARSVTLHAAGLDDEPQEVSVHLNHAAKPIAEFALGRPDQVEQHTFALPDALVQNGDNELTFRFSRGVTRSFAGSPFRMQWSATFVRLDFSTDLAGGTIDDRGPSDPPSAPDPSPDLSIEDVAGVGGVASGPAIVFPQGGRISFGVRVPRGGPRFQTTLYVHPEDGGDGRTLPVTMRLRADPSGLMTLFKGDLDGSRSPDQRAAVPVDQELSVYALSVATIEIETPQPPAGRPPMRLVMQMPRIVGGDFPRPRPATMPDLSRLIAATSHRNLILITLDAASARHFTAYGAQAEYAVAVDTIARDGIKFAGATSPASYTLPSVASLFTGLYPRQHGLIDNGAGDQRFRLHDDTRTLAMHLKDNGYRTHAVVTNPNAGAVYGFDRGFDSFTELFKKEHGVITDAGAVPAPAVADAVSKLLSDGELQAPFFLYAHIFQPHAPYLPPPDLRRGARDPSYTGPVDGTREIIEAYRSHEIDALEDEDFAALRALYQANLTYADRATEQILRDLLKAGLLTESIVCVVGDHGEAFGEHGNLEHGDTTYSEEIEVPIVIMPPRAAALEPMEIAGPTSLVDVLPTLTTLLGARWNAARHGPTDGVDLTPSLLVPDRVLDRPVFSQSFGGSAPARYAVRWLGRSLHADLHTRRIELFDLTVDPGEQHPLPVGGSGYAELLRAALCEHLCAAAPEPGAAIVDAELDHDLLAQMGYVSRGQGRTTYRDDSGTGCPLRRR